MFRPALCLLIVFSACKRPSPEGSAEAAFLAGRDAAQIATDYDVQAYALHGRFDWDSLMLSAGVDITVAVPGPVPAILALDSSVKQVARVLVQGAPVSFVVNDTQILLDTFAATPENGSIVVHVDYAAAASSRLIAWTAPKGDPVPGRLLYTDSEPRGTKDWMPCHNVWDDRARFTVDFELAEGETLIANDTDAPLPPYLMAFAVGDFAVARTTLDGLPIAVAHRKALPFEDEAMLGQLSRIMRHFQLLMGPYPFGSYTLVLLPGTGMENATITFQDEVSTSDAMSRFAVTAHELGHHWFGDMMTPKTWDDVWIKEGMATLLEAEGYRAFRDHNDTFSISDDLDFGEDAIVDKSLPPEEKYGSGIYSRAAWFFNQLRAITGEATFWATLRSLLQSHKLGNVSTEEVMAVFQPHLPAEVFARASASLTQKAKPAITVTRVDDDLFTLRLEDPGATIFSPIELQWRTADGMKRDFSLRPGEDVIVSAVAPDERLVLDPRAVHPDLAVFADYSEAYYQLIERYVAPREANLADFLNDASKVQERTLSAIGLYQVAPAQFSAFFDALSSDFAQQLAVQSVCSQAASMPEEQRLLWVEPLTHALKALRAHPERLLFASFRGCVPVLSSEALFADDIADVAAKSRSELLFLQSLSWSDPLTTFGPLVKAGKNTATRIDAMAILSSWLRKRTLNADMRARWEPFLLDILASTDVRSVLSSALLSARNIAAPSAPENAALIQAITTLTHDGAVISRIIPQALCAVYTLCRADQSCNAGFLSAANPLVLPDTAAETLATGKRCN